jgi:hypothetical protein
MVRSGTTLLGKLISSHPDAIILSQPLPLLYVAIKREFLARTQRLHTLSHRYPLTDLIRENYYPLAELVDFLRKYRIDSDFARAVLHRQISYDGQYHKPENPLAVLTEFESASLTAFVNRYVDFYSPKAAAHVRGSKEPMCEEFVSYLLGQDVRIIILIRDPRDVLTSLNFGAAHRFVGRRKPLLFDIRQWRKSVAFALALENKERVLVVHYENLVKSPASEMGRVTSFLGLEPLQPEMFSRELRTQSGDPWRGNSSHFEFNGISERSVGHYRSCLSQQDDRFVQALCYAELKRLGYSVEITRDEVCAILSRYEEETQLEREELAPYQWNSLTHQQELERWRALVEGKMSETWFPFREAFLQLRASA